MIVRDPRINPRPGDELRAGFSIRRVERDGERLLIEKWDHHYWIRLQTWREWCAQSGTFVVTKNERGPVPIRRSGIDRAEEWLNPPLHSLLVGIKAGVPLQPALYVWLTDAEEAEYINGKRIFSVGSSQGEVELR
jgi:hypothetical protein